jgi:hypothetical protein
MKGQPALLVQQTEGLPRRGLRESGRRLSFERSSQQPRKLQESHLLSIKGFAKGGIEKRRDASARIGKVPQNPFVALIVHVHSIGVQGKIVAPPETFPIDEHDVVHVRQIGHVTFVPFSYAIVSEKRLHGEEPGYAVQIVQRVGKISLFCGSPLVEKKEAVAQYRGQRRSIRVIEKPVSPLHFRDPSVPLQRGAQGFFVFGVRPTATAEGFRIAIQKVAQLSRIFGVIV